MEPQRLVLGELTSADLVIEQGQRSDRTELGATSW